ncbi:hypothetical protein SAMN06297422_11824 [Lachnospiraceae bacterium]|nr:hypothetical protein SAMN06297422_11824 [Lachnospiraceae bacterium]
MQLKNEDNSNQNVTNQNPNPNYNSASPNGNFNQQTSPYGNNTGQTAPYGSYNQQNTPYYNQQNTPYYNQQNTPYGNNNQQAVISQKSSFPVWLVILIAVLVIGAAGYFLLGTFNDIFGKADYTPGTVTDKSYQNNYFEFKTTLGSGWKVTQSVSDTELVKKTLNQKQVVTEFSAQNDKSIEVIGFSVQQTPYNIKAVGTDIDNLMDNLKSEFVKEMEAGGYKISNIERDTMTIAGKTCEGFKMTGRVDGVNMDLSLVQFYMFKGNYVGAFSAASTSQGKAKLVITNNVSELSSN